MVDTQLWKLRDTSGYFLFSVSLIMVFVNSNYDVPGSTVLMRANACIVLNAPGRCF